MTRPLRIAGYIAIGVATGLLVAMLAIFVLTRTEWGMERARRFAVAWLADRVEGTLHVGSIGGRGLLSGVIVRDFSIVAPNGRPFVRADSLELSYNWRTLLAGQIILTRVVLHQPHVELEQLPGDSIWNYEHIFADTTPHQAERGRSLIRFLDAHVRDGSAIIRTPFEPDGPVAIDDTARILLEPVPGGLARVMRFEDINARLDEVIWETPIEPGQLFNVAAVSARGFVQREPFIVHSARGTVTTRDTIIALDFQDVTLPSSQANILGTIVQRDGKNIFDIRVEGRRFQFRDLQWLYPRFPDEGGGSVTLRIQSQPRGTLFLAEDARIQTPGTQLAGTIGVVTGDTLYFTRVNLRASPLDVRLLEQLLPGGLPIEGLLIGTVEIRGPISALETSGDMRLAGGGVGDGSQVKWSGVLDLRNKDIAATSMRADVQNLELALLSALNPKINLDGRVSGEVTGSGRLDQLVFRASLSHSGRGGAHASFAGGGSVRREGNAHAVDITVDNTAASFTDLAHYVPALAGLRGDVHGPVRLEGTSRDLHFDARLATDGGPLSLIGRVLDEGGPSRVIARARGESFRLHALRPELPELLVTGSVEVDITGSSLATATGVAQLVVDSLRVRQLPLGRIAASGTLADGIFAVDSAHLDTRAGIGRARGTVALVADRQGQLEFGYISESLTPFESFLIGAPATGPDAEPRLAGRIDATGTLSGWIGNIDIVGQARGTELVYESTKAKGLNAELDVRGLRSGMRAPLQLSVAGDSIVVWSHPLHSARFTAQGFVDSAQVAVNASNERDQVVHVRADVVRPARDVTAVRIAELRVGAGTPWTLALPGTVMLADGVVRVDSLELGRGADARAHIDGHLVWSATSDAIARPLDFRVRLRSVPFADMLLAMRSTAAGAGAVDATLRFTGTALDPVIEGEIDGRNLQYGDVRIDHAFAELNYSALGLDAHAEAQYDGRSILTGGGRIPIDLRFTPVAERRLDEPLRFTISADKLPPALPLSLIDGFTGAQGQIDGTISLTGTTLDPALSGGFTIRDGAVDWDVTGVHYRDVNGNFTLERDRLLRVSMDARATDRRPRNPFAGNPGGKGAITGTLDFSELTNPAFKLSLTADRVFAARRRDVEATVTGELSLGGKYERPEISGSVRVDEGALYLDEIYRQYLIVSLDDLTAVDTTLVTTTPVLGSMIANARNPFLRNMLISNLDLRVGSETWLRSQDMDVEVTGNLTVALDRKTEDIRLTGSLDVERGTYTLYYPPLQSRRFNVRKGTIEFPGIPGIDPNLSITAAYKARDVYGEPLHILAVVSGSLQNPRVRLTSDDQLGIGESDLASYLFFGVPTSGENTGTSESRGVASLGFSALKPSVLGYASSGLQALVQNFGLLDYAAFTTTAEGARDGRNDRAVASFFAETQLELGRYLFSNVFIGYSQRLGSYEPAGRIEWRFLPEFSFELFAEDRFARIPGFGIRPESEKLKRVYGFSLFREWGF